MTIMTRPDFIDSPYFVMECDNWHLLPGAPLEVVKEFDKWMAAYKRNDPTPLPIRKYANT